MQTFARDDCPFFERVTARIIKAREKFDAIELVRRAEIFRAHRARFRAAMFVLARGSGVRAKFLNVERMRTGEIELDCFGCNEEPFGCVVAQFQRGAQTKKSFA